MRTRVMKSQMKMMTRATRPSITMMKKRKVMRRVTTISDKRFALPMLKKTPFIHLHF